MPEIPESFLLILPLIIIVKIMVIREILKGNKPKLIDAEYLKTNQMTPTSAYHYQDSDGYTLEISENEIHVIRSDKKPSILFTLRPYKLQGKDFVFLQVNDFGEGVNLERMVIPLNNIYSALEKNKLFYIIFSFKGVWFFSDLALSISVSHLQRIEDNGGSIIFCDVDPKINPVIEFMQLDQLATWYVSEAEMIASEKA